MLHDQRRADRVEREGARQFCGVEIAQAFFGRLPFVMQKTGGVYGEPDFAALGGSFDGARNAGFVFERKAIDATDPDHRRLAIG